MTDSPAMMNPFPGLRPFREDEDYLFFGREEQTMELLRQLGTHRFVAVVGTSGSGKSSLVRCGLLSELLGGKMLQAGASWEIAVTHPGGNPLLLLTEALLDADLYDREQEHARENLLATLSRSHFGLVEAVKQAALGESTNFLLVVDQFEEIFRFHEAGQVQREVANEFISLLLEAAAQKEVPIYVVLTMRSDFIGECGQFEGLAEMVNQGEFLIPRLSREQYKRVIEGPIKVAGGQISPRLLQRLLNDLGQQSDQLPCLQHALMRTWNVWAEKGDHDALDLDDYQQVGKMAQALSLHADEIYDSLDSDRQRELCRGMFQALTVRESEQRGIRRPQRLGNLAQILEVSTDELKPIINAYRQSGVTFLMPAEDVELTDRTIIDISHESLMRVWTRLRHWVEQEAQAASIYRRLSESAHLHQQGKAGLYRDPELGIALAWKENQHPNRAWAERYHPDFEMAIQFLEESRKADIAEAEAREEARQRELEHAQQLAEIQRERLEHQQRAAGRLRKMMAGVAGIAVIALIAFVFALIAHNKANRLAEIANQEATKARENADKAEQAQQETEQALTQVEAEKDRAEVNLNKAEDAEKRSRNFRYATDIQLAGRLIGDKAATARQILDRLADHDPDQNEELAGKNDLRGFEWHYLRRMVDIRGTVFSGYEKPVIGSVLTAEGELLTLDEDYQLKRWDVETHLETGPPLDLKQDRKVVSHALSPDGRRIALGIGNQVHLIDTRTGDAVTRPIATPARYGLIFSPDNRMLITVDTRIGWWESATGRVIALDDSELPRAGPVAISADGLTLAIGGQVTTFTSDSFSMFRMDPQTRAVTMLLDKKDAGMGSMRTLALSPDGKSLIASQLFSGMVVLFDAATGTYQSLNRAEHTASVSAIAFSPDGSGFVTASLDGTIKIWDGYKNLATPEIRTLMGHAAEVNRIGFAFDGKRLVSSSLDKTARLWELDEETASLSRPVAMSVGYRARFSPDGLLIAASEGGNDRIPLWDAATGELVRVIPRRTDGLSADSVAFSPDNRLLALGFGGKTNVSFIELWNLDREELLATMPATTDIPGYSTTTTNGAVTALQFSPDGQYLVAGYGSLTSLPNGDRGNHPLLVYDVPARRLVRRLEGPRNYSVSVAFSQDGSRMANACYDGTARVWNTKTWSMEHALQNPDESTDRGYRRVLDVAFSPDGELLATASHEGNVHVWSVETGRLLRTLQGHSNGVWSVAFSPDGHTLASGSRDQTVRLWNRATWRELLQLEYAASAGATSLRFSSDGSELLAAGSRTIVWSTIPENQRRTERLVRQLAELLDSGLDFQNRIQMLSDNPRLQEALEILQTQRPDDKELKAALAASRANWHASREEWQVAVEQYEMLRELSPSPAEDWLRTTGLIRLATAMTHQNRPAEATALLSGGEQRRRKDGSGSRVVMFGFEFRQGQFPLQLTRVYRSSPARQAGLRSGDVILKFNDVELTAETYSKYNEVASGGTGTRITFTIQRPGQEEPETVEMTKASFIYDDLSNELLETLTATVDRKLAESPDDARLHELRAEIAGQSSLHQQQVAGYTAAIEALSQNSGDAASPALTRLYRRRGDAYLGLEQWQLALDDYHHVITNETTDEELLTNQARAQAELLLSKKVLVSSSEDEAVPWKYLTGDAPDGWMTPEFDDSGWPEAPAPFGGTIGVGAVKKRTSWTTGDIWLRRSFQWTPDADLKLLRLRVFNDDHLDVYLNGQQIADVNYWRGSYGWLDLGADAVSALRQGTNVFAVHCKQYTGGQHVDVGLYDAAYSEFQDRIDTDDPWALLAACHLMNDDQGAIDELVARYPESAARIGDLFVRGEDKDWPRAVEVYSIAINPETTDSDLLARRASAYEQLHDWESAAADWKRAADDKLDGTRILADFADRLARAEQLSLAGRHRQQVRTQLESRLQTDSDDLPAIEQLAEIVLTQNEPRSGWTAIRPENLKTERGAAIVLHEDNSLRVEREPLAISIPEVPNGLKAVRIETSRARNDTGFKEYCILSTSLPAGAYRGRYLRIDLPGDNRDFPRNPSDGANKSLALVEVQVFREEENIALKKTARQSSITGDRGAYRAVDGDTNGSHADTIAGTLTDSDEDPWWEVDLGEERRFDRIVVWNRPGASLAASLNHFRIRILDADRKIVFERVIDKAPDPAREITRQFHLTKDNPGDPDSWQLVLGTGNDPLPYQRMRCLTSSQLSSLDAGKIEADEPDWGIVKPASQSSASGINLSANADGVFRLELESDTLALPEWPEAIEAVRVETGHADGWDPSNSVAFKDYRIEQLDARRSEDGSLQGRYVRIDLPGDNTQFPRYTGEPDWKVLSLNEVQVFEAGENVATAGTASQSTTQSPHAAERAIDGTTIDSRGDGTQSFTVTEKTPGDSWWELDLGKIRDIDRIVVWNRVSYRRARLNHFRVSVLDADRKVIFEQVIDRAPDPSREINCRSMFVAGDPAAANQPQWSLRLGLESGIGPGKPFRLAGTERFDFLEQETQLAETRKISQPESRLAAAYDLDGTTTLSIEWFRRALLDADDNSKRRAILEHLTNHPQPLSELLSERPDDTGLQLALARSHITTGRKQLARQRPAEALSDFQHARDIFTRLQEENPKPNWRVLVPSQLTSKSEATLKTQPDGSVFVTGDLQVRDTFTFTVDELLERATAIRLEALRDVRLPNYGPGTHSSGNFVLSEFRVLAGRDRNAAPVPLEALYASFEERPAKDSLSPVESGWSIFGEAGKDQMALFRIADPELLNGAETTQIVLDFAHEPGDDVPALLGHFRLSVTDEPVPENSFRLYDLKESELASLDIDTGKAYVQQNLPTEAASMFAQALDRLAEEEERKELIAQCQEHLDALRELVKQRPGDLNVQIALAKRLAEVGKQALADGDQEQALEQLFQSRDLFAALIEKHPESEWIFLQPVEMTSQGGARLSLEADGSIFVSGEDVERDSYTVRLPLDGRSVTAVRLETLPDTRLKNAGSSRSTTGASFLLTEFEVAVQAADDESSGVLTISDAVADYTSGASTIERAFDANDSTFWSVNPKQSEPHEAVFSFNHVPAVGEAGAVLIIRLEFGSDRYPHRNLGRFRLSVTDDPHAIKVAQFQQELEASGLVNLEVSLGKAYGQRNRKDESATAFVEALDLATDRQTRMEILREAADYEGMLDKLTELRPEDAVIHDALSRYYQQQNNSAGALSAAQKARALYEERLRIDPEDSRVARDLADLLLDVRPEQWKRLEPADVKSAGGAVITPQADGSLLVSGPNVPGDTYTLQMHSSLETIRAIRIEVLPDESLPNKGPGRHPTGNFQLSAFRLYGPAAAGATEPAPQPISQATASFQFSSDNVDVQATIDDSSDKVWHVWSRVGERHCADYLLEKPLRLDAGASLSIVLQHKVHTSSLNLGRFRLSVTDELRTFEIEDTLNSAATVSAPFARLAAAYSALGDSDKSFEMFARAIESAGSVPAEEAIAEQAAGFEDIFGRLLDRFPEDKSLRLGQTKYLAKKLFDESQFQASLDSLSGIADDFPDDIALLNLRAEAHFKLSEWQSAATDYARVIELEADAGRQRAVERKLAECRLRMGRFQEGADIYLRQMLLAPDAYLSRDAYSAQLLDRNSDTAKLAAAEFYEKTAGNDDLSANLSRWMIRIYTGIPGLVSEQNRNRLLQAADKAGGDWTELLTAAIHYRMGNLEQAQPLLTAPRGRLQFRAMAAMLLYDQGEAGQAREYLADVENRIRQQRQTDPESAIPGPLFWPSWSTQLAAWREAKRKLIGPRIKELDDRLANGPEDVAALIERAGLLSRAGLHRDALDDLDAALTIQPDLDAAAGLRGRILAGSNRNEEALVSLNEAIQRKSGDPLVYAARGRILFAAGELRQARSDLEKSMELEPNESAAEGLADLLLREAEDRIEWQVPEAARFDSEKGATLSRLQDHSILASGENPLGDAYTILSEIEEETSLTALRLEALTHESLPGMGPGRDDEKDPGNFSLVGGEVTAITPAGERVPISLNRIAADYFIHELKPDHWNTGGRNGVPHVAYYSLQSPVLLSAGSQLFFRLEFSADPDWPGQNLGRFRLSVSGEPQAFEYEKNRLDALKFTNPWTRLVAAYRLSENESAIGRLFEQQPRLRVELADYHAFQKEWERAIDLYNRTITADTKDALLYAKRAEAYSGAGQWELAEADWHRAFELDPENQMLSPRRLAALETGEQWLTIAKDFSAEIDQQTGERQSYRPRSQLIRTIIERKYPVFEALQKLRPEDTLLTVNLARDYVRQSDWENAVKHYSVVENDPPSEEWFEYAAALLLAGKKDKYRSFVANVVQQVGEVDDPFLSFYLARTVSLTPEATVDRQRAAKWGEQGVADEQQPWFTHAAGLAQLRAGNFVQARRRLEQSAATNWHPELNQLAFALFYAERGNHPKAREYFEQAENWFDRKEAQRQDGYYDVQETDWLEANLLRKEVQQLLVPPSEETPLVAPKPAPQ